MSHSADRDVKIADVVKVGVLGEGSQGTVWTARRRSSRKRGNGVSDAPYALKKRLIKSGDAAMRSTKTSSALREIEFYEKVANRYPEQFSALYDWEIVEATQEMKDEFATEGSKAELKSFTHVLTTLSARKEGVLKSVYRTLNKAQWLSMLSQVCYAIALIHERGFSHGDVWEANVAYMKVPRGRDVHVFRSTVPALGYVWSIIDYGSAELKKDETRMERQKKRYTSYELDDMISLASGEDDAEEECGTESVDLTSPEFRKRVLSSIDGPSVRLAMKKTGLPLHQVLALINVDSYLWHVCGHGRSQAVHPWINRSALWRMSEMKTSYASLALYFARLCRDMVRHGST